MQITSIVHFSLPYIIIAVSLIGLFGTPYSEKLRGCRRNALFAMACLASLHVFLRFELMFSMGLVPHDDVSFFAQIVLVGYAYCALVFILRSIKRKKRQNNV